MCRAQPKNSLIYPFVSSKSRKSFFTAAVLRASALLCSFLLLCAVSAFAQTSVLTQHYDIARTGQNTNETILTPANVNSTTFGKLFSYPVDGYIYAQPLYVPVLTMGAGTPQAGTTHNVIFIATEHDSVYAFDADSNLVANANPLWHITLLDAAHGAASGATTVPSGDVATYDIMPEIGITGTPVIDLATSTLYVVGKTKESGTYVQRLHALDITTGLENLAGRRRSPLPSPAMATAVRVAPCTGIPSGRTNARDFCS
jgi:hypothetical protein